MERQLYSVRMRAAAGGPHEAGGRHISGAERLVAEADLEPTVAGLLRRAREHPLGKADFIRITVEPVDPGTLMLIPSLPVSSVTPPGGVEAARRLAERLLTEAGVAQAAAAAAVSVLANGAGPGGAAMRGAVVMDAAGGRRLEPDPARGVRVSRLDWAADGRRRLAEVLRAAGHAVDAAAAGRVADALAMASKVAWAGAAAEVGWSDDPDYTTGYVAAPPLGYVRIPGIKAAGDTRGGRVFFLPDHVDLNTFIHRLERHPVLVELSGAIIPAPAAR